MATLTDSTVAAELGCLERVTDMEFSRTATGSRQQWVEHRQVKTLLLDRPANGTVIRHVRCHACQQDLRIGLKSAAGTRRETVVHVAIVSVSLIGCLLLILLLSSLAVGLARTMVGILVLVTGVVALFGGFALAIGSEWDRAVWLIDPQAGTSGPRHHTLKCPDVSGTRAQAGRGAAEEP